MKLPPESELYELPPASRTNIKDIFAEKLSLEDAREILADVVEDGTRTRARQVFEGHPQILKVLAKFERYMAKNYGVARKAEA